MNKLIVLALAALLAAGCSKEEPPTVVEEETTDAIVDTADDDVAEVTPDDSADADTDEEVEVVEESAGNDDAEDDTIVLAQADTSEAPRNWKYKEGTHFTRLVPTQPTVGGPDKVEVAEIFMYSCPHCYDLETYINKWDETRDPNVRFVRIPAIFNNLAAIHAQLYYTEEVLVRNGTLKEPHEFREMVFNEYHRRGNRIASEAAVQKLFERAGVDADTFKKTWGSFEVNQKLRVAQDLARRYGVASVPLIVVNGKYRTDAASAGSYPKLMELIDELTAREGVR